jgi:hypothetical protein
MDSRVVRLKYGQSVTFSPGGGITGVEDSRFVRSGSGKGRSITESGSDRMGESRARTCAPANRLA